MHPLHPHHMSLALCSARTGAGRADSPRMRQVQASRCGRSQGDEPPHPHGSCLCAISIERGAIAACSPSADVCVGIPQAPQQTVWF